VEQRSIGRKGPASEAMTALQLVRRRLLRLLQYRYMQLIMQIAMSKDGKLSR
jgi:hypothetical protein